MKFRIYDPSSGTWPRSTRNEYVSAMFFAPMLAYGAAHGHDIQQVPRLCPEAGATFICNADFLTPEIIIWFRDNKCPLVAFSCIDSAYLAESLRYAPEAKLLAKIFMVTGVQNTNISHATVVHPDMSITAEPRQFLPEANWQDFDEMRRAGTLQSLPYVPWDRLPVVPRVPFAAKRPTVLFRGGNHFLRVVAFYKALANGCADPHSGFQNRYYFADGMNPQFRHCAPCRDTWKANGGSYPLGSFETIAECTSPAVWGKEPRDFSVPGAWNNRCQRSFYWLADQFKQSGDNIDMAAVQRAFNYHNQSHTDHLNTIAGARFYADCKWEFSINAAQRFWEAAAVGTVNLMPQRADDQDYFPKTERGVHYLAIRNDLEHIHGLWDETHYTQIATAARALYEGWMRPTHYAISDNLLHHIFEHIV